MSSPDLSPKPVIVGQLDPSQHNKLDLLDDLESDHPIRLSIEHELGKAGLQGSVEGAQEFAIVVKRDDEDNEMPAYYVNVTPGHQDFGTKVQEQNHDRFGLPAVQEGFTGLKRHEEAREAAMAARMNVDRPGKYDTVTTKAGNFMRTASDIVRYAKNDPAETDHRLNEMIMFSDENSFDRVLSTATATGRMYDSGLRSARIEELVHSGQMSQEDIDVLQTASADLGQYRLSMDPDSFNQTAENYMYNAIQNVPKNKKDLRIALWAMLTGATVDNPALSDAIFNQLDRETKTTEL